MICAARFEWEPNDPEIVSDVLFAVANVMSIARTTYLMPAFEVLGPLQISLGRMIGDITRFLVLFTLVSYLIFIVHPGGLYWDQSFLNNPRSIHIRKLGYLLSTLSIKLVFLNLNYHSYQF